MHRATIAVLTGTAVLAGCALTPSRPVGARIVVLPSRQLRITTIRAEDRTTFVSVRGRVARRGMMTGPVWGLLHLEAWGPQGMLACHDTNWTQLSRRRLPASFFSATIQARPSQVEEIRISHETASHRPCSTGPRP